MRAAVRGIVLVAALAVASALAAQEPRVVTLSLEEAIESARANNPAYARALNDPAQAHRVERQRYAGLFPRVSAVSMSLSGRYSKTVTALDDFGNVIRVDDPVVSRSSNVGQSITVELPPLFDGFQGLNQLRAARAGTRVSEAELDQRGLDLRLQVSSAYLDVLERITSGDLEEQLLASAVDQVRVQEELYRVAATTRVDILGARQDVARRESDLARARGEGEKAKLALVALLGLEPRLDVQLTDTVLPFFDPRELDADALVARALSAHPSIAGAVAAVERSRKLLDVQRGTRWPRLTPSFGYSRGLGRRGYSAWTDFEMPRDHGFSFSLSLALPLYDGFERSASIGAAESAVEDQEHVAREARLNLERDIRSRLIDLENTYRQIELSRLSLDIANERLELATEEYRSGGGGGYTSLQQVIDLKVEAERQMLSARFAFARALLQLEQSVGETVRP